MRILFLNAASGAGGAERMLLDVLASLRRAEPGAELYLAAPGAGPLTERAAALGVRVMPLALPDGLARLGDSGLRGRGRWRAALGLMRDGPAAAWGTWRCVRRLRALVARLRPDIIHSNSMKFHLLASLARPPVPVVWHLHDFLRSRPLMSRLLVRVARRAAGAVAISRAVADDARPVLGALPIVVVHNAIDTDHFVPGPGDGARLDALAGLPPAPPDVVRVGLVATFARWKGHDVFLAAAARAAAAPAGGRLRFYVVGGPIYQTGGSQWSLDELRARGSGLLAAGRLGFVGFQDDPAPVYRALDVVVHASTLPEPFGRTIVEAMACARAVVVARAGGAAELFEHDRDAVGVPPGDPAALAAALVDLAADAPRRGELGLAARATAVRDFHRDRLGPQVLDAYRQFLGVKGEGLTQHAAPAPRSRRARRWLLFVVLLLAVFLGRAPLLTRLAGLLVREERGATAPRVALSDGERRHAYSDLVARVEAAPGVSVVLFEISPQRGESVGARTSDAERDRHTLEARGVPPTAIHVLPARTSRTTWDWARALRDWLRDNPGDVVVLTDRFQTRRMRIILDRVLGPEAARVRVVGVANSRFDETTWWHDPHAVIDVFTRFLGLAYVVVAGEDEAGRPFRSPEDYERDFLGS